MSTIFDDEKFGFRVPKGSPRFVSDEPDGIKIAMPETFAFAVDDEGEPVPLPLHMALRFSALYFEQFEYVFKAVKIVVVDDEHAKTFTGGVWRNRHYAPRKRTTMPAEDLAKRTAWEHKTVDLLEFIDLPRCKATYNVYALLEKHKSNVVTIQVKVR